MSIILTEKSKKFIEKKKITNLSLEIAYIEEPCTQIYDPKIEIIKDNKTKSYSSYKKVSSNGLTLNVSNSFIELYGDLNEFELDVESLIKKKLIIKNVDPIIKNVCKV